MSKRVSNKRGAHAGSRCGRVRLGFHRMRRIGNVQRAMEAHRKKTILGKPMDDESLEAMKGLKKALYSLLPKRHEHRGVR